MKKALKLTALAALVSVCGSVAAQSSVTVYGRVDLGVRHETGAAKNNSVATGSFNAVGFRGVEDLGGGLSAYFDLQHRFCGRRPARSANANAFWDEISVVGLRGSFGQIQLGRQGGPYGVGPDPDAFGGDYVGGRGERKAGADDKYNNGVVYSLPAMGGFSAAIGVAESTPTDDRRATSGFVKYASGPLMVSASLAARANGDDAWGLGATYDFGAAKLFLAVAQNSHDEANVRPNDATAVDRKTFDIGVAVPMGAGSIRAKYNNDDVKGGVKTRNIGLGYWHDLSKRTMVYGHFGNEKTDGVDNINRFDLGIRHDF